MKKFFSIVLTVCTLISVMYFPILAADEIVYDEHGYHDCDSHREIEVENL